MPTLCWTLLNTLPEMTWPEAVEVAWLLGKSSVSEDRRSEFKPELF